MAIADCTSSAFEATRSDFTVDCFGAPCDVAASFCCLQAADETPACAPGSGACFRAESTFDCFSDADCAGTLNREPTAGRCCVALTTSSTGFADAATQSTVIQTTCVLAPECPEGTIPTCSALGTVCGTNGGVVPVCRSLTIGSTTMPFGICR